MSTKVTEWCWEHSEAAGTNRLVLIAIGDQANHEGLNAYPSYATIAARCRVSVKTVQRSVAKLEAAGELAVDRRSGPAREGKTHQRPNVYSFPEFRIWAGHETRQDVPSSSGGDTEEATSGTEEATSGTERGDKSSRRGDTAMTCDPSFDPSTVDPSIDPCCDGLFGAPSSAGSASKPGPTRDAELDRLFEEFWKGYPRRDGKKKARDSWGAAVKAGQDPRELVNAATRYAAARRFEDPRFTPYAATWLNQERWNDELVPRRVSASGGNRIRDFVSPVDQSVYDGQL